MQLTRINKHKNSILHAGLAVALLLFLSLSVYACWGNNYFYTDGDEGTYYNGARLFAETGSARAVNCNNENVSKIGHFDWYGPTYHILYGFIDKLLGTHALNFIALNILCLLILAIVLVRTSFSTDIKKLLLLSFATMYVFINYTFTLFPEIFQLLIATILAIQLYSIHIKTGNKQDTRFDTALFILLSLAFSIFRVTNVFCVFGILVFSANKKDFFMKMSIALACIGIVALYITQFQAPYYAGNFEYITHHTPSKGVASILIHSFFFNLHTYITELGLTDILFIIVLLISISAWFRNKNKFLLAAIIISVVYIVALLTFYTGVPVYLTKQTACMFPFLLIALYTSGLKVKYLTLVAILTLSPITYIETYKTIEAHKQAMAENKRLKPLTQNLQQIKFVTKSDKPVTIATLYNDFADIVPFSIFMGNAPITNANNQPILYSFHFSEDSTHYSKNIIPTGKLYVDYFLTLKPLELDSITLACSNDLFYLYKNNRSEK